MEPTELIDRSEPYRVALREFTEVIDQVHSFAHDAYKAPEQLIELMPALLEKCWELQIEWCVMRRKNA